MSTSHPDSFAGSLLFQVKNQIQIVACGILVVGALFVAATADAKPTTPYPGGHWEPGPAAFGQTVTSTWLTMDDGVKLYVTIGYPTDPRSGQRAAGKFPVILQHSPYTDTPVAHFVEHGYIFANVRARGTGASGGMVQFNGPRDRLDGVRIVAWVAKELNGTNGVVGMYG